MRLSDTDLAWLAGLMEGEGSFSIHSQSYSPRLDCGSTDLDIVERIAKLFDTKVYGPYKTSNGIKPYYRIFLHGIKAIEWMHTLKPLLGLRRQARIAEIVKLWESTPKSRTRNAKGQFEAYSNEGDPSEQQNTHLGSLRPQVSMPSKQI